MVDEVGFPVFFGDFLFAFGESVNDGDKYTSKRTTGLNF